MFIKNNIRVQRISAMDTPFSVDFSKLVSVNQVDSQMIVWSSIFSVIPKVIEVEGLKFCVTISKFLGKPFDRYRSVSS